MTTDRLAALLHENAVGCTYGYGEAAHAEGHKAHAARLAAAGVTVAATPAETVTTIHGGGAADNGPRQAMTVEKGPITVPQPAPDALPVNMDDYMAGYRQAEADLKPYGTSDRDSLREKIDRELCRDGQLDWDECSRLADLLSVALWNELSMFPIVQPAPDAAPYRTTMTATTCPHGAEWDGRIWTKVAQPAPDAPTGWWSVSGDDLEKFTPQAAEAMQDALRSASVGRKTIVTIDGITLRWHDARHDCAALGDER